MFSSLAKPLQSTFQVLAIPSNLASIPVLECAMSSLIPSVRLAAVQCLITRGGDEEMRAVVRCIDRCQSEELAFLAPYSTMLATPVEAAVTGRDPEARQQGLVAIARLRIAPLFHYLVSVAESPEDSQQIVATQLLDSLATDFGAQARQQVGILSMPGREQLVEDLLPSLRRFSKHRVGAIVDAYILALHWDDEGFREVFSPIQDPHCGLLLKRLRTLHRSEVSELLCGSLWSKLSSANTLELVLERNPIDTLKTLCSLEKRFGVSPVLTKNLASLSLPCFGALELEKVDRQSLDVAALLRLLVATEATPDVILRAVVGAALIDRPDVTQECASAIRSLRTLKPEIVVMVLSDCFSLPDITAYEPPPWKASLKSAIDDLLEIYYDLPSVIRSAVDGLFSEFRCEELFQIADTWPEPHVRAYGRIVRFADYGCVHYIDTESQSTSVAKRTKAIRMIRYLGKDERLQEIAVAALSDEHESVRIQAIHAIAYGNDRESALELLGPLLADEDLSVKTAASQALEQLQMSPA
jgi:hypothetical protein